MHPSPPPPHLTHFWTVLRAYLEHAFSLFGAPIAIARQLWLNGHDRALVNDWLRVCESLLRRLIFAEAQTLTLAPDIRADGERKHRSARRFSSAANAHFNLDDSSTWRVAFRLTARIARKRAHRGPARVRLINAYASAPLALRLEALVRGFNDPAPLIERCARALKRNAERVRAALAPIAQRDAAKPGFHSVIECDDALGFAPLCFARSDSS